MLGLLNSIDRYEQTGKDEDLRKFHSQFLKSRLFIIVSEPAIEIANGEYKVSAVTQRNSNNENIIQCFISEDHIRGRLNTSEYYLESSGKSILGFARQDSSLSEIEVVSPYGLNGHIPRSQFSKLDEIIED